MQDVAELRANLLEPRAVDDEFADQVHEAIEPLNIDADGLRWPRPRRCPTGWRRLDERQQRRSFVGPSALGRLRSFDSEREFDRGPGDVRDR